MDAQLLRYYERELQHLRELGGEFASAFPKVAGRLGIESQACADPFVERLLEGFSFLAARVQLKIDAEFPKFTQHLLEVIYPHFLAPTPSMLIAQLQPSMSEGSLKKGYSVPRGSTMRGLLAKGDQTPCEYRTAHAVTMWPIELTEARYFSYGGEIGGVVVSRFGDIKAGLRLRLKVPPGLRFSELALDELDLYIKGSDSMPARILEQILAGSGGVLVKPTDDPAPWHELLDRRSIAHRGFADDEALLPYSGRSFQGYRLLSEYFSFPQRFMFLRVSGLQRAVRRCDQQEIEVVVLFDRLVPQLEQAISAENFALHCTPAINLFEKRADRIHLSDKKAEFHVVADRTKPLDYEIFEILGVTGYGSGADSTRIFKPLLEANNALDRQAAHDQAFYQVRRDSRITVDPRRQRRSSSGYLGSEIFVSLVDMKEAPFDPQLRQLGVETLCTNRDLPLSMPLGTGETDFMLESNAPVAAVRCVAGPTAPIASSSDGRVAWQLISHLSLNYLSLVDSERKEGASGLKDMLRLYCPPHSDAAIRQIEGLRSVRTEPVVRRLPVKGPITYGRGIQVRLTLDEGAFEYADSSVFLLGAVLEQFFTRYVAVNSFAETVVLSERRGEIMSWPARIGACEIL